MFLLTRDTFLNHCPMKLFVICQFDIFTFVISHAMCSHTYYFFKFILVLDFWWGSTKGKRQFSMTGGGKRE